MHKGQITMLGRIMAGSQAVIAHDEKGQAVFVAYHPPDIHVSRVIIASCQQVALATGRACHRPGGPCNGAGLCVRRPGLGLAVQAR